MEPILRCTAHHVPRSPKFPGYPQTGNPPPSGGTENAQRVKEKVRFWVEAWQCVPIIPNEIFTEAVGRDSVRRPSASLPKPAQVDAKHTTGSGSAPRFEPRGFKSIQTIPGLLRRRTPTSRPFTMSGSSMNAMIRIRPWHLGHVKGSTFPDHVRDRLRSFGSIF
jgi:hypothetical protein